VGRAALFGVGGKVKGVVLIMLSLTVAAGCVGTLTKRKLNAEDYRVAVEAFNDAIRWHDYQMGLAWIAPQQVDLYWKQTDTLQERIRIYDYQILKSDWSQQTGTAMVLLRYRFYHPNEPTIRTKDLHQKWQYDDKDGNWRVTQTGLHVLLEAY